MGEAPPTPPTHTRTAWRPLFLSLREHLLPNERCRVLGEFPLPQKPRRIDAVVVRRRDDAPPRHPIGVKPRELLVVREGMDASVMAPSGWATILSYLPKNWAAQAAEHGLCRSRVTATGEERSKLRDPGTLLRLVLHHVQTGASLDQTVTLAAAGKIVDVSRVALH